MSFGSLQTRIFVLVLAIVGVVAAAVMLFSHREVERVVVAGEGRAMANVLDLVALDVDARYQGLLKDKIRTIQGRREQVETLGQVVRTGLDGYVRLAERGELSLDEARRRAVDWLSGLSLGGGRYAFAYDRRSIAVAHPNRSMIGHNLTAYLDLKGRRVAPAMFAEAERLGRGFATYRWPRRDGAGLESKFGYFLYYRPLDWVVGIADDVQDVESDVNQRRGEIIADLSAVLQNIAIAQSGFVFIFSGANEPVVPPPQEHAPLLETFDAQTGRSLYDALKAGTKDGGVLVGAYQPAGRDRSEVWETRVVHNKALDWHIAALVPRGDLQAPATALVGRQAAIFVVVLLAASGLAFATSRQIARPLSRLTAYARLLPKQQLSEAREGRSPIADLPGRYTDEVGRLAEAFLIMEDRLRDNVQRLMAETSARERIDSELAIAHDIQLGLLPDLHEALAAGDDPDAVDLHAVMRPAKEVGGDFFDVFYVAPGTLCVAVGDVSGKGVPGAFFMAVSKTLLRAAAETASSPDVVVRRLNEGLAQRNPNMMFVTAFLAFLDIRTGRLDYVNAGHPPPFVLTPGQPPATLPGLSGPALGVVPGQEYAIFTAVLPPDVTLVVLTDGITEAGNREDVMFGDERTAATLAAGGDRNAAALVADLFIAVESFAADAPQADDMTVLAVRRPGEMRECRADGKAPAAAGAVEAA